MNIKKLLYSLTLVMSLSIPGVLLFAQEIPVTTSSKEAKKIFIQGRDKLENSETILAAELLDKAIALDPNFAMAYLLRSQSGGNATISKQNREKAVSLADKVSEGEKHWILLVQATVDGDIDKRTEHISQLLKLFPNDKRVHVNNGFFLNSIRKPDQAIASFLKATELDKNYGPAFNQLGYAYMGVKNWKEAEKAFKRYIEIAPTSPNPIDSYADMLMRSGRFDEAITNYKKAYSMSPTFINAFTQMGACYSHKGDFANAKDCNKQQFEKAPTYNWKVTALINSVQTALHEGDLEGALKKYSEIVALAQNEKQYQGVINAYSNIGFILLENNNASEAAKNFNQARILTEKSELTDAARETARLNRKVERFSLLLNILEFDAAEKLLLEIKQIVDARKNPVEMENYYTNWGILERYRGNYDKALEAFAKANVTDPYVMYQKAIALEMKGDREAAKKTYEEVVNWNWIGNPYALIRNKAKQKVQMSIGSN